jgi:hypothetical protein
MAHFAELDGSNIVLRVLVIANKDITVSKVEDESVGVALCTQLYGGIDWKQTSYNNNFRKQYAGIGYIYDAVNDVFIIPQPFPSWSLDGNFDWQAPTPLTEGLDQYLYNWDEDTLSWVLK